MTAGLEQAGVEHSLEAIQAEPDPLRRAVMAHQATTWHQGQVKILAEARWTALSQLQAMRWSWAAIARAIGVSRSRISQIRKKAEG